MAVVQSALHFVALSVPSVTDVGSCKFKINEAARPPSVSVFPSNTVVLCPSDGQPAHARRRARSEITDLAQRHFCPPEFDVPFHRTLVQKKFRKKQKPVAAYANVSEILKNGLRTVID